MQACVVVHNFAIFPMVLVEKDEFKNGEIVISEI